MICVNALPGWTEFPDDRKTFNNNKKVIALFSSLLFRQIEHKYRKFAEEELIILPLKCVG